jgi:hypothetical protein
MPPCTARPCPAGWDQRQAGADLPSQSTVDLSGSTVNGASLASAIDLVCDSGVPGATGPALIGGALSMSGGSR